MRSVFSFELGKRDHSGEELFVTELGLLEHLLPVEEVREFHLAPARKHLPSLMKEAKLASTIQTLRANASSNFKNVWLLKGCGKN